MIDFLKGRSLIKKLSDDNLFKKINEQLKNENFDQSTMKFKVKKLNKNKYDFLKKIRKLNRLSDDSRILKKTLRFYELSSRSSILKITWR